MIRFEEKPSIYDGVSCDLEDYFIQFENVAAWNGWSDSEKACQLVINLRGEAQSVLKYLKKEQLADYSSLKELLFLYFKPRERCVYFKSELQKCKQNEGEPVSEFYLRFSKLCQNAYLDLFHSCQDYFIDLFLSGLRSLDMKKHVYLKNPKSLEKAFSLAVEFESIVSCDSEHVALKSDQVDDFDCLFKALDKLVKLIKNFAGRRRSKCKKRCFNFESKMS